MSRRKLTEDEIDLWKKVASQTERLSPAAKSLPPYPAQPKPKTAKPPEPQTQPQPERFEIGSRARSKPVKHDLKPSLARSLASDPVQMDDKAFRRMKRGKLRP